MLPCGLCGDPYGFHPDIGDVSQISHQCLGTPGDLGCFLRMLSHYGPGTDGKNSVGALVDGDGIGDAVDQRPGFFYGAADIMDYLVHGSFSPSL